jgi:hypothetical protein
MEWIQMWDFGNEYWLIGTLKRRKFGSIFKLGAFGK